MTVGELGKHGGDRRSKEARDNQGDNVTLKERGNQASYLVARLKRDAPEILAQLERGEYPSVRVAKTIGVSRKTFERETPEDAGRRNFPHTVRVKFRLTVIYIESGISRQSDSIH